MVLNLDEAVIRRLRNSVNSTINSALVKKHYSYRAKESISSWNQICALMDRIQSIVWYFREMKFHYDDKRMLVFDFYAFMTQADVLDDCISTLAHIYDVNLEAEDSETVVFMEKGENGKGTDKKYFEYLRSLCVVHPGMTDRFDGTYTTRTGQCSPYVLVNDHLYKKDGELIVRIYYNDDEHTADVIGISLKQIFCYVERRYSILDKIVEGIHRYDESVKIRLMKESMKDQAVFDDYIEYLRYLKEQTEYRFPVTDAYEIEFVIRIMTTEITDERNLSRYQKYCNALRYAISFEHTRIQKVGRGTDDEMGIVNAPRESGFSILYHLIPPSSGTEEHRKHSYAISKLEYLVDYERWSFETGYAKRLVLNNLDYFGRYVSIDETTDFEELYVLIHVGLYFDCMDNDCILNKYIPMTDEYRDIVPLKH